MQNSERRDVFRKGLSALYLPIYDALCAELPPSWQPYYGLRTLEEQDRLYASGRTVTGPKVTQAKGGESAHNYGCASDWTLWDKDRPLWLPNSAPEWEEFSHSVTKVGGDWGGFFSSPDCPHVQLGLTIPWKSVRIVLVNSGMDAAMELIKNSRR